MNEDNTMLNEEVIYPHKNKVHHILAHSYLVYFSAFLLGIVLDLVFPTIIFEKVTHPIAGFSLLLLGTLLVGWAQGSSAFMKKEKMNKNTFLVGPYKYTRSPTHYGLFLLMLGFGIVVNASFIIILSAVAFLVTKFYFLKKEEKVLMEKYGEHYTGYHKSIKL